MRQSVPLPPAPLARKVLQGHSSAEQGQSQSSDSLAVHLSWESLQIAFCAARTHSLASFRPAPDLLQDQHTTQPPDQIPPHHDDYLFRFRMAIALVGEGNVSQDEQASHLLSQSQIEQLHVPKLRARRRP